MNHQAERGVSPSPAGTKVAAPGRGRKSRFGKANLSRTRQVFFCWLYAQSLNPGEECDPRWICRNLEFGLKQIDAAYLDILVKKYQEKQVVIEIFLSKFLKKEYPTLDLACSRILLCLIIERACKPELPIAVAIDEAVRLAHEFSSEGYQVVNALAEKIWKTFSPTDPVDGNDPPDPPSSGN